MLPARVSSIFVLEALGDFSVHKESEPAMVTGTDRVYTAAFLPHGWRQSVGQ